MTQTLINRAELELAECRGRIKYTIDSLKNIKMVNKTFDRLWRAEMWESLRADLYQRKVIKTAIRTLKGML